MTRSIIADAPIWAQAAFVLAWGACTVAVLHILREARYRRDPYSHDIKPIATAHESRLVPVEDDRAARGPRRWADLRLARNMACCDLSGARAGRYADPQATAVSKKEKGPKGPFLLRPIDDMLQF